VTAFAGPRRLSGPDDTAFVVGVTVPLPLWNRSRGAIAESEHRVAKVSAQARAEFVRSATELANARVGLEASSEEADLLRTRVLPGTERAVQVLRRGYEQGRFAQIEVLDAERARLDARVQYLRALVEAHHSAQQIERLTGVPLEVRP
jgi:cobalt-zinc-cadmium efflux system outer membrane protein